MEKKKERKKKKRIALWKENIQLTWECIERSVDDVRQSSFGGSLLQIPFR